MLIIQEQIFKKRLKTYQTTKCIIKGFELEYYHCKNTKEKVVYLQKNQTIIYKVYNKNLAKNIKEVLKEIGENPKREGLLKRLKGLQSH